MQTYLPEGKSFIKNTDITIKTLKDAMKEDIILESKVDLCDSEHNLVLNFKNIKGIIKREQCAIGIENGTVRDIAIISRVNKPVCFKVIEITKDKDGNDIAYLSRKLAQESCKINFIDKLKIGDIIDANVTHLDNFGAFVDIGCGIISLIPIDLISVSRISHPNNRFEIGQNIMCIVKNIADDGKICLSHKELLGTWSENADMFKIGETVKGIVRSVESYGIFIELTPNLAGLSEVCEGIKVGDTATVYIKNIIHEKMKVKLVLIYACQDEIKNQEFQYFIKEKNIKYWKYSPESSKKIIETVFK